MSQRGGGRQTAVEEKKAHILCGSMEEGGVHEQSNLSSRRGSDV